MRLFSVLIGAVLLTATTVSTGYATLYGSYPTGNVPGNSITFSWHDTTHAPSYKLQIAYDAAFTSTSIIQEESNAPSSGLLYMEGFFPDNGRAYYWRVIRNDNNATSAPVYFVNGPSAPPSPPYVYGPTDNTYLAGKDGFFWISSDKAFHYYVTAATDSYFYNDIQVYSPSEGNILYTDKLFSDGSKIYWKAQTWNSKGWSSTSPTISFTNDCNMSSVGFGGGLSHIDTCSDDYTARSVSYYFLKDMTRRSDNPHLHNGEMARDAAIITGLNSENLRIETNKMKGTPIVPLKDFDNYWAETTDNKQDAIRAHAYTGDFYDYLLSTFRKTAGGDRLNSFDGSGRSMYNLIKGEDCSATVAYWRPDTWNAHFCTDGASWHPELVGHEWGHAVSARASSRGVNLDDSGDSGALEEAFVDWMGLAFKKARFNNLWTVNPWKFGPNTSFADNFADITRPPNYYSSLNGYHLNGDPQVNSRLPNTMFYLLAAEGEHEHPFSKIKVRGIGIENAIQIAFRANMKYWETNVSLLQAAKDMSDTVKEYFSQDPNNLHQVKNAWAAVGVEELPQVTVATSYTGEGTVILGNSVKKTLINGVDKQYEPVWGQSVTVTATPPSGHRFANWTEGGTVVENASQAYTFTADRDRNLVANFIPDTGYDFRTVSVGQSSVPQTITIGNYVEPPKAIIYFNQRQITGTNPGDFEITRDTCSGQPVIRNATCEIEVVFRPQAAGLRSATLSILATANGQTVLTKSSDLIGNGFSASISVYSSSTQGGTVTLGGSQLYGGTATATATPNSGYAFTGWFEDGVVVSSSASYSFTVTTSRSLTAMFSATPPVIVVTPVSGNFGTVATGASSPAYTFTVSNSGLLPLTLFSIVMSGVNSTDFNVPYNDCGSTLAPSSFCKIRVAFSPSGYGARGASLIITSDDPATPSHAIYLSGYGGAPAMAFYGSIEAIFSPTLQSAYNDAGDGMEIRLWATDFNENLNCNRPVFLTLRGGYNGNFADKVGKTALKGTLTIGDGTVIIDGLQLGGSSSESTVTVTKNGFGTVSIAPSGVSCGTDCSASLLNGTSVTLTATPDPYASFIGWSGGVCSGEASTCTFTLNSDTTVTVSFTTPYPPAISVTPISESFGDAIMTGTSTAEHSVYVSNFGQQNLVFSSISLSGEYGQEFAITADDCSPRPLLPDATCTVKIRFSPTSVGSKAAYLSILSNDPLWPEVNVTLTGSGVWPILSVVRSGAGSGVVTSTPSGINCGGTELITYGYRCCQAFSCHTCTGYYLVPGSCSKGFAPGTTVSLSAIADSSSYFAGWESGSNVITLTNDASMTAVFQPLSSPPNYSAVNGDDAIGTKFILPGTKGVPYEQQLLPAGGGGTGLSWDIVAGELPPGLNFNPGTGRLSGTPSASGNYPVTFRLTDADGATAQSLLPIYISDIKEQWVSTHSADYPDNSAVGITVSESGDVFVTGTCTGSGATDMTTIKYDLNGNQVWLESAANMAAKGIAVDGSGNVAVAGTQTTDTGSILTSFADDGMSRWSETCPSFRVNQVKLDNLQNICLTGQAGENMAVFRYSPQGAQAGYQMFGTFGAPKGVAVDSQGNFYAATEVVNGTVDIVTRKISPEGSVIWESLHDSGTDDTAVNLVLDDTGSVYISGHSGSSNPFLVKYDGISGAGQWQSNYGWTGYEAGKGLTADRDGNLYVSGRFQQASGNKNAMLIKIKPTGVIEWAKLFDVGFVQSSFADIAVDSIGNIIATGWINNQTNTGTDFVTVKFGKSIP